ncbi:MAG: dehydrogenase E1 component subunit alpha/beta [Bacteroidetes bacterium]|nr:dehydrogenase E1 component subunit alpha/beta [Bacteroidota bacterium]
MKFKRQNLTNQLLLDLYKALMEPRMIEEKMSILLRQGKISKWFSGIGQEAISIGAALALEHDEFILPMHRNLGIFTARNIPLHRLFAQFQGKNSGFTKGRDRSFHFGSMEHHIVGMISHLGPQMSIADGIALAHRLKKEKKVTLVFCGDGASSEGEFHEALNVAAVWDLPVIFLIENNGYGLSTPNAEQFKFKSFQDKGPAYGIKTVKVDGNNLLDVYTKIQSLAKAIRKKPHPVLVEAITFRMRGHEEASSTKYVPLQLMESWAKKDPVDNYQAYLIKEGVLTPGKIEAITKEIKQKIESGLEKAYAEGAPQADAARELSDVFATYEPKLIQPNASPKNKQRFVDALSSGLKLAMEKFPNLILMGQDIAEYGGVFKVTEGLVETFGKERVRNTPICESAIIGTGLGLSIHGYKSMIEMQFADFVSCGFNQIVNNLAKIHYRWGQNADVVIRMPTGAGLGAGPFHSQSNEAWFFHTPGLKIFYPSDPLDAKGLLLAAFEDPNPVLFFEHKALYRAVSGPVPEGYYTTAVGKSKLVTIGDDISIITYGMGVHWALDLLKSEKMNADLLDLRTLVPWDKEGIFNSVKKTGKVLILHEDCITGGIGAEIAAWISENCFEYLDGPVMREASLDTAVPFSSNLEDDFLPQRRLKDKLYTLIEY